MNCKNHPDRPSAARCAGCGEEFCQECLSQFNTVGEAVSSGDTPRVAGLYDYCGVCLKAEAVLASARMAGSGRELARMKKTLIGCSVVLIALLVIPMLLLVYPVLSLGDVGRCRENLRRIYATLVTYAEKNEGAFPPNNNDLSLLFADNLLKDAGVFYCAGARRALGRTEDMGTSDFPGHYPPGSSYLYQGGLTLPERGEPARPLLWDRSPRNHRGKGINVLHTNGVIKFERKGLSRIKLRETLPSLCYRREARLPSRADRRG